MSGCNCRTPRRVPGSFGACCPAVKHLITAYERGWTKLKNGELLDVAEKEGFEVLVTTDLNLKHQQNLQARRIAIVALSTPSWPRVQHALAAVVQAVDGASSGNYVEVEIP